MRKILYITAIALAATMSAVAQTSDTLRVATLRDERWWGLFNDTQTTQPFNTPFTADLSGRSSTMPLLVSSQGRYIWAPDATAIEFDGKTFSVACSDATAVTGKKGRTVREAYLYCIHRYVWPESQHEIILPKTPIYVFPAGTDLKSENVAGTVLIPDGWQSYCDDHIFDLNVFPDPQRDFDVTTDAGYKTILTVTPYIPACGRPYTDALKRGDLLTGDDSRPVIFSSEAGYFACLDVTVPHVRERIRAMLAELHTVYGIETFLFDCSQILPELSADKREDFSFWWKSVCEAYPGSVTGISDGTVERWHPTAFMPATNATWQSLADTLTAIIAAGFSGYTYPCMPSCTTAGGDELLQLRILQLAAMMPLPVIYHVEDIFSSEKLNEALANTYAQRLAMLSYTEELLRESTSTGEPTVRHMDYQFPGEGFADCDDQYMLGAEYLIAPVTDPSGKRTVRLPKGRWQDCDGTKYKGPRVVNIDVSDGKIPVFKAL